MNVIINNEKSFTKTLNFCKKYFQNVKVIKNESSHLANRSQNFFKIILFENRGCKFSIKWNHNNSTLFFGDITKKENSSFQFVFTKMKLDSCYPIEEGNNLNVMFWQYELIGPHDNTGTEISPLRIPIPKI